MRTIYKLYFNSAYHTSWVHVNTAYNTSLIIQLAKKSNTTHDPMGLWLIRWQAHVLHKVSGVACGRESTSPLACFGNRGDKMRPVNNVFLLAGFEPHNRHAIIQNFPVRLSNHSLFSIPSRALHEQAVNTDTVLGWSFVIFVVKNLEVSLPADVFCGSFVTHSFLPKMNAWRTNPKGRLRGGHLEVKR